MSMVVNIHSVRVAWTGTESYSGVTVQPSLDVQIVILKEPSMSANMETLAE